MAGWDGFEQRFLENARLRRALASAVALTLLAGVVAAAQPAGQGGQGNALATDDGTSGFTDDGSPGGPADDVAGLLTTESTAAGGTGGAGGNGPSGATSAGGPGASPRGATGGTTLVPKPMRYGKGVTDTSIRIGLLYLDGDAGTAGDVVGSQTDFYQASDPKAIGNTVIDYINSTGGITGRRIEPVWAQALTANYVTPEGRQRDTQAACATWTEDRPVFAMPGTVDYAIVDCAVRSKTPTVVITPSWSVWLSERRMAEAKNYFYTINSMPTERRERVLVQSLARQGYFTPGAKVGLMVLDEPPFREGVEKGLKPALAALGVDVAAEIVYPDIVQSPWPSYVVQMQSRGVTHVIFSAATSEGFAELLFMRAAQDQLQRFQYGISGLNVEALQQNAPREQTRNARGFAFTVTSTQGGWNGQDYPPVSTTDEICRGLMRKKGFDQYAGSYWCDYLFFLKTALDRADELTAEGFARAVAGMGTAWQSTQTFGGLTRFGPNRPYGSEVGRDFAWNESLGRFEYTSPVFTLP